jgi:hypothetical protein
MSERQEDKLNIRSPLMFISEDDLKKYEPGSGVTKAGWYFSDETWAFLYGPFESLDEATEAFEKYADSL